MPQTITLRHSHFYCLFDIAHIEKYCAKKTATLGLLIYLICIGKRPDHTGSCTMAALEKELRTLAYIQPSMTSIFVTPPNAPDYTSLNCINFFCPSHFALRQDALQLHAGLTPPTHAEGLHVECQQAGDQIPV